MKRLSLIESELGALPDISSLPLDLAQKRNVSVDCLRLDKLHPFISGNKWFKLQHHLLAAEAHAKSALLSFGGAYSNHLHALAYAGQLLQMKTIGVVRGEAPEQLSPTLEDCLKWGMELRWISRERYRQEAQAGKHEHWLSEYPEAWIIPEGGEGLQGLAGIQELFARLYHEHPMPYELIVCPVGSGTTLAGIALASAGRAQIIGISALKGAFDLEQRVGAMLGNAVRPVSEWQICHDFHFGGFARVNTRLTDFISDIHSRHDVLLDPVYTGKMLYGICEWIQQGRIASGARVLLVHTGGLQGWRGMASARPG